MRLIKRLCTYLAPFRFSIFMAIIILVLSKGIEAWIPIQIGQLSQDILTSQVGFDAVLTAGLLILGWLLFQNSLDALNITIKNRVAQNTIVNLRMSVYRHIQGLPITYFDHQPIGKIMTRTIHDVEQINQLLAESAIPLIGSLTLFVGIYLGLFLIEWRLALAITAIVPLLWWMTHRFRIRQRIGYKKIRSILSSLNSFVQEYLMGVQIVRHFGLQSRQKEHFQTLNKELYQSNLGTVREFSTFFSGLELVQSITLIVAFVLLVKFTSPGEPFQAGTFFTISLYSFMVFRPLFDVAERYNILQSAMAAAERVFEVLDIPLEPLGPQPGLSLDDIETIEFKDVWFAYEAENWILKNLSFVMKKGESVAMVGFTGSGKTSVMNLLLRFYDFQKGSIFINGNDIRSYSVKDIRRQFSLVLQEPVIFSGTIEENITLYDPAITLPQVELSAKSVDLSSVVARLPKGFQSVLGERGQDLSVGEMQLIGLARAVAHQRPVLLFDEATSNIDPSTEKKIKEALNRIVKKKTAFIIAHRLSTVQEVSKILVLSQGSIIEYGTHSQLVERGGVYEKLYRLQFTS